MRTVGEMILVASVVFGGYIAIAVCAVLLYNAIRGLQNK